jgi:hypothetical protein
MLKIGTSCKAPTGMAKATQTLTMRGNLEVMKKQKFVFFNNFSRRSAHVKSLSISDMLYEDNSHDRTMISILRSNTQCMFMVEE